MTCDAARRCRSHSISRTAAIDNTSTAQSSAKSDWLVMRKSTCSHVTASTASTIAALVYCTTVPHNNGIVEHFLRCTRVPPVIPTTLTAAAPSSDHGDPGRVGQETVDDDRSHAGEPQQDPDPLPPCQPFAEHPARRQGREHGVQPGDECGDAGRQPPIDGDEHATEVEHMHAHAGEHDPRNHPTVDTGRRPHGCHAGEQGGGQHHPNRKKREGPGVVRGIPGDDESGAPQHHEDPRRGRDNARRADRFGGPPFHDWSGRLRQTPPSVNVTVAGWKSVPLMSTPSVSSNE